MVDPFLIRVYAYKKLCGFDKVNLHKIEVMDKASRRRCMEKASLYEQGAYEKSSGR